mmetsp:Transcript_27068/g.80276  ORF Transcript_27068/g.80276 Transcript_27068/m.80276 type:complete len:308 (-) Transcript_27068:97-1020(-)
MHRAAKRPACACSTEMHRVAKRPARACGTGRSRHAVLVCQKAAPQRRCARTGECAAASSMRTVSRRQPRGATSGGCIAQIPARGSYDAWLLTSMVGLGAPPPPAPLLAPGPMLLASCEPRGPGAAPLSLPSRPSRAVAVAGPGESPAATLCALRGSEAPGGAARRLPWSAATPPAVDACAAVDASSPCLPPLAAAAAAAAAATTAAAALLALLSLSSSSYSTSRSDPPAAAASGLPLSPRADAGIACLPECSAALGPRDRAAASPPAPPLGGGETGVPLPPTRSVPAACCGDAPGPSSSSPSSLLLK